MINEFFLIYEKYDEFIQFIQFEKLVIKNW